MVGRVARWKLWAAGVAAYALLAWWLMPASEARPEARAGETGGKRDVPKGLEPVFQPVRNCSDKSCHGGEPPAEWIKGTRTVCRCDEAVRWKAHDRHELAYKALESPKAAEMGRLLGKPGKPLDVTKEKACLTCHGVYLEGGVKKRSEEVEFKAEEGVSCTVCHGEYNEWVVMHSNRVTSRTFRNLPRPVKWARYGMRDLWDPHTRAELCASCHVGNIEQGKFVTHEMYAAGHPPLPGFEPATFSKQGPPHWQLLRDKDRGVQKLQQYAGELEEMRLLAVGAAVSLREAMGLMVHSPKSARGLDLAHFDCLACHHGLKSPSWRQDPDYLQGKKPGRIYPRGWSDEAVRVAIEALPEAEARAERKKFDELRKELLKAFGDKPFGPIPEAPEAARKMYEFAHGLAQKLNTPKYYTKERSRYIVENFPEVMGLKGRLLDFDSARQVVWSFDILLHELRCTGALGEDEMLTGRLKALGKKLKLEFPAKGSAQYPILGWQRELLDTIRAYGPTEERGLLSGLRAPRGK